MEDGGGASRAGSKSPLRSAMILVRSAEGSQLTSSGGPYQTSQATSQTKPSAPSATKDVRQSNQLTRAAVTMAPSAGPAVEPPLNSVVTSPRSRSGNQSRMTRPHAGNVVASL